MGIAYAAPRDGHRVLVLRPAPRLEALPLDVAQVLASQVPRRRAAAGTTALAAAVVWNACQDAGLLPCRGPVSDQRRALARAWLRGELEQEVPLSVAAACAAVGLDGDALAAAVRRSAGTNGQQHERT